MPQARNILYCSHFSHVRGARDRIMMPTYMTHNAYMPYMSE